METKELFEDIEAVDEEERLGQGATETIEDDLVILEAVDEEERIRRLAKKQHIEEMKLQKQRTLRMRRCILCAAAAVLLFVCFGIGVWLYSLITGTSEDVVQENVSVRGIASVLMEEEGLTPSVILNAADEQTVDDTQEDDAQENGVQEGDAQEDGAQETDAREDNAQEDGAQESASPEEQYYYVFNRTEATTGFDDEIVSGFGILVDVEEGTIIAERKPYDRMYPASMTKILTVLTAAEILGIEDESSPVLEDSFTITREMTDYCLANGCSAVGFDVDETVSVRDLFYGTILPSGADAAVGLAVYVSGSHEEFVNRMNEKLKELGLSNTTHIANCVGLFDENHYSTVHDIAVILKTAVNDTFCRQVLSAHNYTTSFTGQHPEGIPISNWFLCNIEDEDTHGEVLCAKTGFIDQAGRCAASLARDGNGREYFCVTAGSSSSWQCIDDQTALFQKFLPIVE